ncbi:hypothetical protein DFH07DRAFT_320702 [Mycena maculata]|uniref:Arrestin-like N-terminal domain-containing protein n=1 Tax=Mycena maculata TaxID=230809 RepID=A0AAD7KC39_9AGAR|nr:hypothetical protein DFH07DRAFT_320702 [Mycena maculata]
MSTMTETVEEPPSYDGYGFESLVISSNPPTDQPDLPIYTRRPTPPPAAARVEQREPKKFAFEIKNRGKTLWATLLVHGDPRLSKVIPTVLEGSNLEGSFALSLQSPDAIQAICIVIKGEIVKGTVPLSRTAFLESKKLLWSSAEGDPQAPGNTGKNSTLKLKGEYIWPFSIELPKTLSRDGKTFSLPHTFLDRLASFSIQYTAELRMVRGKLRPDDRVMCTFGYFSMRQPGAPSMLRQLAYQENSPLLGPDVDPEGWHTQPFSAKGTIFSSRMIDIKCMLSLATPLSYTRSASIPCAITLESNDLQALDLLSSPTTCFVYLERIMQENSEGWRDTHEPCGQAVFWPSTEGAPTDSSRRRQLMGEIHLKSNLQPSSAVFEFAVEYAVVVFPFQAAGFKPVENAPLLRQSVEITTRYAPGPRQKTHSPPTEMSRNGPIDYYYYSLVIESSTVRSNRGRSRGG